MTKWVPEKIGIFKAPFSALILFEIAQFFLISRFAKNLSFLSNIFHV